LETYLEELIVLQIYEIKVESKYHLEIEAKTPEEGYDISDNMTDKQILDELNEPIKENVIEWDWIGSKI